MEILSVWFLVPFALTVVAYLVTRLLIRSSGVILFGLVLIFLCSTIMNTKENTLEMLAGFIAGILLTWAMSLVLRPAD